MSEKSPFVVSADWLQKHLEKPGLSIVDASWYLPAAKRDAIAEYEAAHIPGAVFFDQDKICDETSALPHSLPKPEDFAQYVSAMGITVDDTIIVYDGVGFFSAPRAWWMFKIMGAKNVFVLDGGLDGWKAEGRPLTSEQTKIAPSSFHAKYQSDKVISFADMRKCVAEGSSQIADARGPGRFSGEEAEPRAGMRSGHMKGAKNVHYATLSQNGQFKNLDELRQIFESAGIDPKQPVVTSCGSGVTAAVITLALSSLGNDNTKLYDGSWSEWGAHTDTEVVTGKES